MGEHDTGKRKLAEAIKSLKRCAHCGNDGLLPEHRFCGSCGTRNPDFSSDAFSAAICVGVNEFFNLYCANSHTEVRDEILEDGEGSMTHKRFPFCFCCGERFVDAGSDTVQ